jgi:probable phosphoglycerate mutase
MGDAVSRIEAGGKDFLERLGYKEENGIYKIIKPNDEKVALFCHAAFSRAWLSVLLHIPINIMWASFSYTHTGVTVLEFKNNENGYTAPQCLCFSDMSHLYAAGLDLIHDNSIEL